MSWRECAPGPFSLWARFAPRAWPLATELHVDPVAAALAVPQSPRRSTAADALPAEPPSEPEVTYLPPVAPERSHERDEFVRRIATAGGHALVHLRPGEVDVERGGTAVVDLLSPLLVAAEPEAFDLPAGAWVVVPLISGLLDGEAQRERWLDRLAVLKVAAVVGLAVALEPTERRRLAEVAGEGRWDAIFHGEPPAESAFARAASAAGLATIPPRPNVVMQPRAARNRELASVLCEAGEIWLRLGRGEAEGEALLAAARRIAASALDFSALAREGNLPVVDWLSLLARRLIEERLTETQGERAALLREWTGETAP